MAAMTDQELLEHTEEVAALLDDIVASLKARVAPPPPAGTPPMAWGARVSQVFRDRVYWLETELFGYAGASNDLMACIAWESGRTFSPSVKNMAGSGAIGLIQFMPTTAAGLKTSTAALAAMTAEDQLNFVYKYFLPFKGKIANLSDMYCAILFPPAVGKPDNYALFSSGVAYRQNSGLDADKNGAVTKAEAVAKVYAMRAEGLQAGNVQ